MPAPTNLAMYSHRTLSLLVDRRPKAHAPTPADDRQAVKAARTEARSELADQLADLFALAHAHKKAAKREAAAEVKASREEKKTAVMALFLAEKARRAG
jgi:hypothetical protein